MGVLPAGHLPYTGREELPHPTPTTSADHASCLPVVSADKLSSKNSMTKASTSIVTITDYLL